MLKGKRADYGAEIVSALARQLETEYGSGFSEKNLRRMIQFADVFPDEKIVVSLIRQLSWTHIIALIPLKDPLQREFYAEMCRVERSHPSAEDRLHAIRANGPFPKTGGTGKA